MGIHQGQIGGELSSLEELKASNRRRMIILSCKRHRGRYPGLEEFHACESFLSKGNAIPDLWALLRQQGSERFPDKARLSCSPSDIRAYLVAMAEVLTCQKTTVAEFVRHLYQTAFRRQADEGGFAHWVGLLVNGHVEINQVIDEFLSHDEHKSSYAMMATANASCELSQRARQIYNDLRGGLQSKKAA